MSEMGKAYYTGETAVAKEPELASIRTQLSNCLERMDTALDRLSRTRARVFGDRPQEIAQGKAESPSNGLLDSLRQEIASLENLTTKADKLADDFDRLA